MSKHGIIGNADVAPLYDPAVHPDVALRVNVHRAKHDPFMRSSMTCYVAERIRQGTLTLNGIRGPKGIERITVEAPTLDAALVAIKRIAREYFQPSRNLWRVGNHTFIT